MLYKQDRFNLITANTTLPVFNPRNLALGDRKIAIVRNPVAERKPSRINNLSPHPTLSEAELFRLSGLFVPANDRGIIIRGTTDLIRARTDTAFYIFEKRALRIRSRP